MFLLTWKSKIRNFCYRIIKPELPIYFWVLDKKSISNSEMFVRNHLLSARELSCILTIAGGNITLEDLEGYSSEMEEPLEFRLNNGNFTLMSPQPPSGGIVVGHILKILDGEPGISDEY